MLVDTAAVTVILVALAVQLKVFKAVLPALVPVFRPQDKNTLVGVEARPCVIDSDVEDAVMLALPLA